MSKTDFQAAVKTVCSRLRKQITITLFVLFVWLNPSPASIAKTVYPKTAAAREEHLRIFDDVWETVRARYYDENLRGVDWQAQRENFRGKAAAAVDSTEFYRILRRMLGALHDSHTRIYSPGEKSDWRSPRFVGSGATVREIENEIVVTNVEKDSPAHKAGLQIGDQIITVNQIPANQIIERRIAEQPGASTAAAARLRAVAGIIEGAAGAIVNVEFKNRAGRRQNTDLPLEFRSVPTTFKMRRENNVLIISFDAFAPEVVREFYRQLNENSRGTTGIVLDLRNNRGGSAEAMTDVASALLPAHTLLGKFIDRTKKTVIDAETRRFLLYTASAAKAPNVPIVILTATATASAAEIFASALKESNRARVIGTTTCGCVLAVKGQHALLDGGALEISEFDFQLANGARLEGIGVNPDETVLPTRKDLLNNRDRALERAFVLLKN